MADMILNPRELGEIFDVALDRCFERLRAGEKENIAFLIVMDNEGVISDKRITVEVTDDYFEPVAEIFSESPNDIRIYALAVVGHLSVRGRGKPAVFIEAGEKGNDECMVLAHRYRKRFFGLNLIKPIGRLELVGMKKSKLYVNRQIEK